MAYFAGFDIGTESVGWAVTDEQYRVSEEERQGALGRQAVSRSAEGGRAARLPRRQTAAGAPGTAPGDVARHLSPRRLPPSTLLFSSAWRRASFWRMTSVPTAPAGPWAATRCSRTGIIATATITANSPRSTTCGRRCCSRTGHLTCALSTSPYTTSSKSAATSSLATWRWKMWPSGSCLAGLQQYLRDEYGQSLALADAQAFSQALTDRSLNVTAKRQSAPCRGRRHRQGRAGRRHPRPPRGQKGQRRRAVCRGA